MSLPFDGAITDFYKTKAPDHIRESIAKASKKEVLSDTYPYDVRMKRDAYDNTIALLQIELVKLQRYLTENGKRLCLVFEGRDAAGKGGTIRRLRENLAPRVARTVALSKPTDHEKGQWYFQRYTAHMPSSGQITIFDRSWYNRGVVEKVFDFCTDEERTLFFRQAPEYERMLTQDDIVLVKFWLNVGRAEQLRRIMSRERDPLKQWKLSWIDVEGLNRWDAYTDAIGETLHMTHSDHAPWTIVRSDDKRRARIAAIRHVLQMFDYDKRNDDVAIEPDPTICGSPAIWDA
ncbi:polyphosphate kinase 2 [Litoreibacter roseus]|uniref:ADP/GDP-polyphosphate phosphotransferase n=1 Tax=Litoreibacter roseus TaxID=2601869 RepID=A0A6N6JCA4_9RHOB|nr:polyphosphate kinase 2 [Litoreibacter roseus]GFE63714.1 polyphosphate kinase 2 [Litoreibacter roseus]